MNAIVKVLMERDGLTRHDAMDMLLDAKARVAEGEDPEEILTEEFGLEPDYIEDLL